MSTEESAIDSIDAKIISLLLKDARIKTKDLARECNLSSTAVGNRIKRLKRDGVIVGSGLVINMRQMGRMHPASISIERIGEDNTQKVISIIKQFSHLFVYGLSIGKADLTVFLVVKDPKNLEQIKNAIRKYVDGRVSISLWDTPELLFDNIQINPKP